MMGRYGVDREEAAVCRPEDSLLLFLPQMQAEAAGAEGEREDRDQLSHLRYKIYKEDVINAPVLPESGTGAFCVF